MQTENSAAASARIMQMITGFWTTCCVYVACKLDIPDLLTGKPKSAVQLAKETQTHEPSLYRLLRALSSIGVFMQNENNEFELTPFGNILRNDIPGSMKASIIMNLEQHYSAWGNLLHSVKTGEIAFNDVHHISVWGYYENHPEKAAIFNKAMAGITSAAIMNILPVYDFSIFPTIVDIGGGNGALLCGILKATENSKGIVFDSEEYVKDQATQNIIKNNLQNRCRFEPGSFFEKVPAGASAYLMKSVLHDWDDEDSAKILANVQKAMPPKGKLLIIETVIPERNIPHAGQFMDINMLVMTGGRERTASEWRSLIEHSGLAFSKIIPTNSPLFSIIEAEKI